MLDVHNISCHVPIDCPICQFMMRDSRDSTQHQLTNCCTDCWIGFLEPLRKLNVDDTYLPNSTEIKIYREKIILMNNMEK
jgi:hypothetical protein